MNYIVAENVDFWWCHIRYFAKIVC